MSWEEVTFESIFKIQTKNGLTKPSRIRGEGFKFINMGELFAIDRMFDPKMELVPLSESEKLSHKIEKGDLLFARQSLVASGAGKCSIVKEVDDLTVFDSHIIRVRLNQEICNSDFYYYYFKSSVNNLKSLVQQGVQAGIRASDLSKLKVHFPPLQTQKRIASILSAYDDLIENNLKRIKLLEETAQNIYKEWFVNFRFPNYKNTPFNKETGLPEGWGLKSVKDYCEIISRGPSIEYKEDEAIIPVLNQSCIRNGEIELEKIRLAAPLKENKEYCYLKLNDILINSMGDGTLGRVSKNNSIEDKYIIHNCITFLRAKSNLSQTMLYGYIASKQDYFISVAQGSTGQSTLNLKLISELKINTPTKVILDDYDKLILPLWQKIGTLKRTNHKLKEARDILLPRLMNRTIEV